MKYEKDCPTCDETNIVLELPRTELHCVYCNNIINKNGFRIFRDWENGREMRSMLSDATGLEY